MLGGVWVGKVFGVRFAQGVWAGEGGGVVVWDVVVWCLGAVLW